MADENKCNMNSSNCPLAGDAAEAAVRKVFSILGVDVDNPEKVEEFRKSLRWSDDMRKRSNYGALAIVSVLAAAMMSVAWAGIQNLLGKH